jgi:hypothetical protein
MSADRAPRYILLAALLLIGAALFYVAGLATGLYVASSTMVAQVPATAAPTAVISKGDLDRTSLAPSATVAPSATLAPATPVPAPTSLPTATRVVSMTEDDSFAVFWEAWSILQDQFYGELPTESELPYAAMEGVIASTGDPYTAILDPVRAEIMRTDLSGSFEGIGATVRMRPDGRVEIVQPLPDQQSKPACAPRTSF